MLIHAIVQIEHSLESSAELFLTNPFNIRQTAGGCLGRAVGGYRYRAFLGPISDFILISIAERDFLRIGTIALEISCIMLI